MRIIMTGGLNYRAEYFTQCFVFYILVECSIVSQGEDIHERGFYSRDIILG